MITLLLHLLRCGGWICTMLHGPGDLLDRLSPAWAVAPPSSNPCFWGPRAARPGPTRLGRNRVDSPLDQALEASLSPPCTRALTASPRRRRITGGQRTRLTPNPRLRPLERAVSGPPPGLTGERPDGADAGRPPWSWR